jgi:hypothetical protein
MRWALFGIAMLVALGAVMIRSSRDAVRYVRPDFTVPEPAQGIFGHLFYTETQSEAVTEAGFAIQKGRIPTQTMAPAAVERLREVDARVQAVECRASDAACVQHRVAVLECLDEAGALIGHRLNKTEEIPWDLYKAAMGVSVVTREIHYRTIAALVHFCARFAEARDKFRPKPGTVPRS